MRKLLIVLLLAACDPNVTDRRGVSLVVPAEKAASTRFDTAGSAALFVGVRDFPEADLGRLEFTVDDAVDLAHTMVFERKVRLVRAPRVVLALSGEPVKPESRRRLGELRQAGAKVTAADRRTIAGQLRRQSKAAGRDGLLIFFLASHGFTDEGTGYVMASTSRFQNAKSALSVAKILELAETSPAQRGIVFIDACRERVPSGVRAPAEDAAATAAPLVEAMKPVNGQVLFYAAAPGGWAYEANGNGVFTRAIIDSLTACDAPKTGGWITAEDLGTAIEDRVRKWIRGKRDIRVTKATQMLMDVQTRMLPLARCSVPPLIARVQTTNQSLTAFDEQDKQRWTRDVPGKIERAEIVDLDDDDSSEVVAADASGNVTVFTADGERQWSQAVAAGLPIEGLTIDYLAGKNKKRHIVAFANAPGDTKAVIAIFTSDGTLTGRYTHPGRVRSVLIDRMTAAHDPRLIAADLTSVFMLDGKGKRRWSSAPVPRNDTIQRLGIIDIDNNSERDIEVHTTTSTIYLTFTGTTLKIASR